MFVCFCMFLFSLGLRGSCFCFPPVPGVVVLSLWEVCSFFKLEGPFNCKTNDE